MVLMIAAAVIVVAVGAYLYIRFTRPVVLVTQATQGPVVQAFYSTGTVQPQREYPIKSNLAGVLDEVLVDKGDRVAKGQTLARVAAPELEFSAAKARAELDEKLKRADALGSPVLQEFDARITATSDQLEIAKREHERAKSAAAGNVAPQADVDRTLDRVQGYWSQLESLRAQRAARLLELTRDVEVARAALNTANWNLQQRELQSPIDGVVLDRPASAGTRLAINDHVMQIADVRPENLIVRAQVDEEDKTQVREGQVVKMSLYAFADRVFDGTVQRIYDKADAERRTFEVDVQLDQLEQDLAAGMTGELAFIQAQKDSATVVPSQAVQAGVVWAVRDNKVVKTDAKVGIRSVERAEVLAGLEDGAKVIVSPIGALQEGQTVREQFVDPDVAAGLNKPKQASNFKGFGG